MKRVLIFSISAFWLVCFFASFTFASESDDAYQKAKTCYEELKLDIDKVNEPKNWYRCIADFKAVAEKYPKSEKAPAAFYSAARLHRELYERLHNLNDVNEAIHLYNSVIRDYPQNPLADDALYQIGLLRHDPLRDDARARKAFRTLIDRYPEGDMAEEARTQLDLLGAAPTFAEKDVDAGGKKPTAAKEAKEKAEGPKKESAWWGKSTDRFQLSRLETCHVQVNNDATIVTLTLDQETPFTRQFVDYGPRTKTLPKLTLHFPRTKLGENISKKEEVSSPYLNSIEIKEGVFSGEVKVRFEMGKGATYKITQNKERTIIHFFGAGKTPTMNESDTVTLKKKIPSRKLRIVIDPGHGGEDRGAVGPYGTEEKNVTLAIAKQLAGVLEKNLGAAVYLTRTRDKNVPLEKRNALVNAKRADLFISIHANAVKSRKISGIETYYLNNASDEAAKRLASRENKASAKPQSEVDRILLTLFQNYNTDESRLFAKDVHRAIMSRLSKEYPNVKNRDVRSALFYVLVSAKCPGILVEAAYLSNPTEEKRLKSKAYQSQVALAIAEGVKGYVRDNRELAAYISR